MANSNYRIKEVTNGLGEVYFTTERLVQGEDFRHEPYWETFETLKAGLGGMGYFTATHVDLKDAKKAIKDRIDSDEIQKKRNQKTERIIPYDD